MFHCCLRLLAACFLARRCFLSRGWALGEVLTSGRGAYTKQNKGVEVSWLGAVKRRMKVSLSSRELFFLPECVFPFKGNGVVYEVVGRAVPCHGGFPAALV